MNKLSKHPKLVTLGIGLGIIIVIGIVMGMVDHQAIAVSNSGGVLN